MTYTLTIPSLQGFDIIFVCSLNWVLTTYLSCILFTCARTESVRMTHFHFISTSTQSVTMTAAQNSYHFVVVDSNVPVVVRIWYSSSSKGERNSKNLSSNSYRYIDSVKSLIIQTLRIIWVRCIPLSLRSKTRRRAALGFSPVDREGMSASPFPLRQTWRFYLRSISQTQFLSNDIPHSPAYGDIVRPSVRCVLPCGHDTDYSFCPITFKLYRQVVDDERRNPIDFAIGSWSQRSPLPVCL